MRHFKNTFISVFLLLVCLSLLFVSCKDSGKTFFDIRIVSVNGEDVDFLDDESIDIVGKVGEPVSDTIIVLASDRVKFSEYKKGYDVSYWFTNTVEGLRYELQSDILPPYDKAEIKIYGTPLETQDSTSYSMRINIGTFIAGTVLREAVIENMGKYKIASPDSVILEVLYPQEIRGQINAALPKSYDIVLHLKKDGTRENLLLTEKNEVVLGTDKPDEKSFINRIEGLVYTLNTLKSEDSGYYDTLVVTVSGTPSDSKVHTEDIEIKVPLTADYIGNLGQYSELKGVNVVQNKKINYNISEDAPPVVEEIKPEIEKAEYEIVGTRNRRMNEHMFKLKLKSGTGSFVPREREAFEANSSYKYGGYLYKYITGHTDNSIKWEWEVKSDETDAMYLYISGTPYYVSISDFTFHIPTWCIQTVSGRPLSEALDVPMKYYILHPEPQLRFENRQILISDMDGNPSGQMLKDTQDLFEQFSYSVDNPNFVNNLYDDKTSLIISVGIYEDDTNKQDDFFFNVSANTPIYDNVVLADTIEYNGETIENPLKKENIRIYYGAIVQQFTSGNREYLVRKDFSYDDGLTTRFAIIIEIPSDEGQGDNPIFATPDLIPLCIKVGSKVFSNYTDETAGCFVDQNGNPAKDGEQVFYEVSAGKSEENRSYVGIFERKYTPYIADGAALVYYEDYYTESPFKADDKLMILRPRLSDNASMTMNNGVPLVYQTDPTRPDCIGALVLNPKMDPDYPTHIPASSFPDVSNYTRRGFKMVGWSTVMGSGLVGYSTPLNGDNGGESYKNTIENVAKWGLWLPRSAGYAWPTRIEYPVSLAWYYDFDNYWTKTDISNGGTTFIPTFNFVPKSDATNTSLLVKSDEKYKVVDKDGNELTGEEAYPDSDAESSAHNTTDNTKIGTVYPTDRSYSNKNEYNEVAIPAKGYAIPDSYYQDTGKTIPHKLVIDHDFAMGEYFVTGYMHEVLYRWNIGNGTESNPEHGYIIPPLSQTDNYYGISDHNSVGYVNPTKLISYDQEDRLPNSHTYSSSEYGTTFYNGGALITNSNNVLYGGFSKRASRASYSQSVSTRSWPLTWVSFTQAMVICNAFTEYYNEKSGQSLTPAYTTDHSLSWSSAVKKVDDAIKMIGSDYAEKIPATTLSWNFDTFANLEATGFRLPTYDEWEFATKIFIDRTEIANEDSDMYKRENTTSNKDNYQRIISDLTHAGQRVNQHPKAKGYKANAHANRTLGAGEHENVNYAVANGSSYPMFLTDPYTPLYYGPYRLDNISEFLKINSESMSQDQIEDKVRPLRLHLYKDYRDMTLWYGSSYAETLRDNYGVGILPSMNMDATEMAPLKPTGGNYRGVKTPTPIGLYGVGGYVQELTDRFSGTRNSDRISLNTTNGTVFMPSMYYLVYPQEYGKTYYNGEQINYDGEHTFKVHPNVHYPNQGMRMVRTIN